MPGKSKKIAVCGHAYTRKFLYSEGGKYHEITAPGGAALLAEILHGKGLADPVALNATYRGEHLELGFFEDKKAKKAYYAVTRHLGVTDGTAILPAMSGDTAIVWDEGFCRSAAAAAFPVPENVPLLWASDKALPEAAQFAKVAAHTFLFLDADVLRTAEAMISRQISWERTATELIWQLQNNPKLSYLLSAPHILITFAEDGAVHIWREQGELKAELALTHGGGEGTMRGNLQGKTCGAFALMTAGLAEQFAKILGGKQSLQIHPILRQAEILLTSGHTVEGLKNSEYPSAPDADGSKMAFPVPLAPGQNAIDPDNWCISNNVSDKRIFDLAFDYVLQGAKVIDGLPQLSFGALTTVDRWEIESYQNIRNLIVGYAADDSVRPLSIAVFGSPGSGKSFGVTQIAKNVLPGKVEKLEFNVSQFTGLSDLGDAFQKVRDVILEGKLPLVFFDEFDSDKEGLPRGWIKSFLMPMQDGKFKDESGEHPLGKCILVFAGGTASGFAEFTAPLQSDDPEERQAFKNIKGPDFVSRLKGTINVLGPNPKDDGDKNYILRRALLLRSMCERKLDLKKGDFPVSKDIIWAMLLVPQYKHGARSMESILDMSSLEGNVWEPVSLPFTSQLALHVDADAFIKLVLREVILNSYIEQLALAIHADFCGKNPGAVNAVPWDQLQEEYRESNRDQARSFAEKLKTVGYTYDAGDTPFPSVDAFRDDIILLLAQNEHIRWMQEKIKFGWEYRPLEYGFPLAKKTVDPSVWKTLTPEEQEKAAITEMKKEKKSHLLCAWEDLPPGEPQKDIDAVSNIIPLLKSIGLRVYKTV